MKIKLPFIPTCILAVACCAPLATAASKKSPPPSAPSPTVSAATNPSPTPKTKASPSGSTTTDVTKARAIPFHGTVSTVDQRAKTFTIAGKEHSRVFKVTEKSVLTKAGAAATMKDVVANEEVRGSYWKLTDGTLEAKTVKLGPKTDAEKAADEKHKKKSKSDSAAEASPSPSPKP